MDGLLHRLTMVVLALQRRTLLACEDGSQLGFFCMLQVRNPVIRISEHVLVGQPEWVPHQGRRYATRFFERGHLKAHLVSTYANLS
jgi:hypothetical protein